MKFVVHVLSQHEKGNLVPEDEVWRHSKGYMNWFYKLSHPLMISLAAVPHYTTHVPPYEEVIVEQQWPYTIPTHYRSSTMSEPELLAL